MRLSPGQVEVLKALTSGKKYTSNVTIGDVVSGTAASALEKRGLVKRTEKGDLTFVVITPAGRKELKDEAARAKSRAARKPRPKANKPLKPVSRTQPRKRKAKISAAA